MEQYMNGIEELRKMLVDAKINRLKEDPTQEDKKWEGFIQGIEGAIYRLEMNSRQ